MSSKVITEHSICITILDCLEKPYLNNGFVTINHPSNSQSLFLTINEQQEGVEHFLRGPTVMKLRYHILHGQPNLQPRSPQPTLRAQNICLRIILMLSTCCLLHKFLFLLLFLPIVGSFLWFCQSMSFRKFFGVAL